MKQRMISLLMLLAILLSFSIPASATETTGSPKEIWTVEELMAIAEDPESSYILMADLDMAGVAWKSLDFYGTFDGNGHAILNLTITKPSEQKPDSIDGNRKHYETTYYGMFGVLRDAEVSNLILLNVRSLVELDSPVFLGGLAGYAENTQIRDCTLSGTLELRAHDRMFGVGGLVGFGSGRVEDCSVDVTLICTDTDDKTRDEQFLGGIYGTGFMNVYDCNVNIDGYISEHGYVHSGGIVGMFMEYPFGTGQKGYVQSNHVSGKITFFENNPNRRAYCSAMVGEALVNRWYLDYNTNDFQRDERRTYDVELRPEMCENPVYTEEVTAAGCTDFGYTTYSCTTCDHSYRDHYTLKNHEVLQWTLTKAPTLEEEGLSVGNCGCGLEFTRPEPKLEPKPTTAPETEAPTQAATVPVADTMDVLQRFDTIFYVAVGTWVALLILALVLIIKICKRK